MTADSRPIRVFMLDDDEDDYLIVRNLLSKIPHHTFTVDWSPSISSAKAAIDAQKHDVYLIDYRLGGNNGLELLEWARPVDRSEPFVIMTGAGDEEIERDAMQLGAADYLVKGSFTGELLSRTLRYAIQRKQFEARRVEELMTINRTKDEFISLASHQLRTPATAVKQYLGMILEGFVGDVTDAQKQIVRAAYDSNERQINIVNELLYVALVDAGKLSLKKERVNINKLLRSSIKEQAPKLSQRKQTILLSADESIDTSPIIGDSLHLQMALDNLIDNASKYSEPGKPIEVNVSHDDDYISVAVRDQGVGIAKDDMDKLFQKFSRIYNTLSAEVGGSGLGLYWTDKVIRLHGGDLSVASKPGAGSTFTVRVPR
ncbi:MAG: hypothetical protein JWM37_271 [Candidatus Saccharibacteria bacterium]|nr:hypothetical protein [Candidatus Saccharibacteria bacterium]